MLACVVGISSFAVILWLLEWAAEQHDLRRYAAPGYIATDRRLHLLEKGSSGTAVILESGLASTSISWSLTQQAIAGFTRVIAYDRAGLGWSAASQNPLSLNEILEILHAVVQTVEQAQPVILVGHSFGGLIVSVYAHLYPQRVSGLVLVDPVSLATYANPDRHQTRRLEFAVRLARRGAWLAQFGVVRAALWLVARGRNRLPILIGRISAGQGSSVMNRLAGEIAKLPASTHGPIRSHWSRPGSFRLLAQYLELVPAAARQAQPMPVPPHIPVILLSAATASASELTERDGWASHHPASRHTQIPGTTHWIQLDRPDLVASAVSQLMNR